MRTASRLFAITLMLLNASTSANSLRAADSISGTPADRPLIQEVVKQFVLSWNQDDATQLSRLFTPNGMLISPSGASAQNRSRIKEMLIYEHREVFIGTVLRKTIKTIRFQNSAAALVKGQYELSDIKAFLGFTTSVNGTFAFHLEKHDGVWLINRAYIRRKQ